MDSTFPAGVTPLINGLVELASVLTTRLRDDLVQSATRPQRDTATTSKTQTEVFDWDELIHLRHIANMLNTMRMNSVLTDVALVCGAREFDAHRNVMAAACPFFESAFTKGWTTSSSINLPNISAVSMEAILTFIYTHKLTDIIGSKEAMMKLLEDANYLQMDDLVKFAYKMFSEFYLTTRNFTQINQFVENLNNDYCLSELKQYLAKHFSEISKSSDFLLLKSNQLESILRQREVDKSCMEEAFMSVLKWLEAMSERENVILDILGIFETWCPECLNDIVGKNMSPKWNYKTVDLLSTFCSSSKHGKEAANPDTLEKTVACIKENKDTRCFLIARFNKDNTWDVSKELPFRVQHGAAVIACRNHIFLFGGQPLWPDNHAVSAKVLKFCPLTHKILTSEETLVTPVASAGVGILNDSIYIINGVDDEGHCLAVVQRYNPKEGTCQPATSTNRGHCWPLVCSINGNLIIVSSSKDDGNLVECYDVNSDQWTVITSIPGIFYGCNAVASDSQVFVLKYNEFNLDGDQYESKFHVYDVQSDSWTVKEFESGPKKAWDMVSANISGKPVIFTVESDGSWQKFDVESVEWETPFRPEDDSKWFVVTTFTLKKKKMWRKQTLIENQLSLT